MTKGWDMKKLLRYCGLVAIAGAVLYLPNCDDDGSGPAPYTGPWKIVTSPEGLGPGALDGVFFVKPDLGYAVGCGATIIKYDGKSWKIDYFYPTGESEGAGFEDVWFNSANDGWVVGNWGDGKLQKGLIMHYDGVKWREVENIPGSVWWECVFFLDKNNGWVGGYGISRWDGSKWHSESDVGFITALFFNSPTDGWAVSKYSESIYHYDGTTWTRVHDDPWGIELYSVWFTSPERGWAGGSEAKAVDQSNIMEYKNGKWRYYLGPNWEEGIKRDVYGLHFSGDNNGWAVGQTTYRWDGDNWLLVKPPGRRGIIYDVFTISENDAWAVGDGRTIFHYEP